MQPQHNYNLRAVAVMFAIAVFSAGCSSTTKTATTSEPKKAATEEEYTRTTQLGSWIPKKVKKGSKPKDDGSVQTLDPEALVPVQAIGATRPPPLGNNGPAAGQR